MLPYSGPADAIVGGEHVCQLTVTLDGDPTGEWGGTVRSTPGELEPPDQISRAPEWVLRLPDGKEATVTSRDFVMQTGDGVIVRHWETGVDGIGEYPV